MESKPIILISACIEHEHSRYDGTMISSLVVKELKPFVTFIPVCPEMAIGMSSPRDAVRLTKKKGDIIRLTTTLKGIDFTKEMNIFSHNFLEKHKNTNFDGFIFKAKSPTCGIDKIKIYSGTIESSSFDTIDNGFFSDIICNNYNSYPRETERRLSNFNIREHFYIRIFTTSKLRSIMYSPIKNLVLFHSQHKYLFMTFSSLKMKKLGQIVANNEAYDLKTVYDLYRDNLILMLINPPSKRKRLNVLTHMYGYFKTLLSEKEKAFYFETEQDYVDSRIPFSSVLQMIKSFAVRFNQTYLLEQTIFCPYPKVLLKQRDSGKKI